MFCQSFPDLAWLKQQAESRFANRKAWNNQPLAHAGWPTIVLNVQTQATYRDNIPGPLSFFSNFSGHSWVEADGHRTRVGPGEFVITNTGQRYTLEVEHGQRAETMNIHFGERWAEDAWASLHLPAHQLLDNPHQHPTPPLLFHQKLHRQSDTLHHLLRQLVHTRHEGGLQREELLFRLLPLLWQQEYSLQQQAQQLASVKKATREEILKRLLRATDYIHAFVHRPLSLVELAHVSCLSRFHFLRLFHQLHGTTPHQYVTRLRIQKSQELLRQPGAHVLSVARALGFDTARSFSRLFAQHTGMAPSQYQQRTNN